MSRLRRPERRTFQGSIAAICSCWPTWDCYLAVSPAARVRIQAIEQTARALGYYIDRLSVDDFSETGQLVRTLQARNIRGLILVGPWPSTELKSLEEPFSIIAVCPGSIQGPPVNRILTDQVGAPGFVYSRPSIAGIAELVFALILFSTLNNSLFRSRSKC
jgi:DNA-binding LacI/PurR family transcriptional regulator